MPCAGEIPREDSCAKDGGGRLYCGDYQRGGSSLGRIYSFESFRTIEVPCVYTDAAMYIKWIDENK